jgi:hypothetical protein
MCSMSSAALELIAKARELTLAMTLEGDGGAFARLYPCSGSFEQQPS